MKTTCEHAMSRVLAKHAYGTTMYLNDECIAIIYAKPSGAMCFIETKHDINTCMQEKAYVFICYVKVVISDRLTCVVKCKTCRAVYANVSM